jgi:bifunctional DNA-binding transcriptional regulator/antitoxin component of YhaV-PrlF toxin-antitoxin module
MISTTLTIDDDGVLQLPEEMLIELGWNVDDELLWIENDDGSFVLKKVDHDQEDSSN